MAQDWFVLVESNTTGTGRHFVQSARMLSYRPIILTENPARYSYIKDDAVEFEQCNTRDQGELQKVIDKLARDARVAGIYSSSEYFIEGAAQLASRYELPGADPDAIRVCRNKVMQRECLRKGGVRVPAFQQVTYVNEARDALCNIPLPVVVKPVFGSGSVGVRVCSTEEEVLQHADFLLQQTVNERGIPQPAAMLIEEYMTGNEYSVEILGKDIVGITAKHVSPEPYFVETGHDFPAELPCELAKDISTTALQALQATGLQWGPAHVEIRATSDGAAIVEINPRLAGGFIPKLVHLASGIDMILETLCWATGRSPTGSPSRDQHASIRFIMCPGEGVILNARGLDEAAGMQGVADVQLYRKPGDRVLRWHDFRDRIGHIISTAHSGRVASRIAEAALDHIKVALQPNAMLAN